MKTKVAAEFHSEIVAAYTADQKVTCHKLGQRYNTYDQEIRRILRTAGVTLRDGRHRRGADNPIFKNGQWVGPDGYVRTHVSDDHPFVAMRNSRRYAMEHRLVMADHLGRPLTNNERVHHKNGIKDDNRIENLEIWTYSHPPGQRVLDKPPHCPTCTCTH